MKKHGPNKIKSKQIEVGDELPGQGRLRVRDDDPYQLQPLPADDDGEATADDAVGAGAGEDEGGFGGGGATADVAVDLSTALGAFSTGSGSEGGQFLLMNLEPGTEHVVMFFYRKVIQVFVHLVMGYRRCLGERCPACAGGLKKQPVFLCPVYNLLEERIEILRVPSAKGPNSLAGKIKKVAASPDFDRHPYRLSKAFEGSFTLEMDDSSEGSEHETPGQLRAIKNFITKFEAGSLSLSVLIPEVTFEELEEKFANFQKRIDHFTKIHKQ